MAVNKLKLKTVNRLCEKGFDTAKKVSTIDMRVANENDLNDEIGSILDLQDAIKIHMELAWLCDGEDRKKEVKQVGTKRNEGTAGIDTEAAEDHDRDQWA